MSRLAICTISIVLAVTWVPVMAQVPSSAESKDAVEDLASWLQTDAPKRPCLHERPFSTVPLTKSDAETAGKLLWSDLLQRLRTDRAGEWKERRILIGNREMRFDVRVFGDKPASGRSLFISMHGGGSAPKTVNDRQWENQKRLYKPAEGVYIAPRAPTDAWDMWFQPHMGPLFEKLITAAVAFEDVNPDRVYLTGYSAGGDGVFRMAPRLADRWAAAAMMAGHPGEASPLSLRNLPFAIHVGENDSAYERNKRAAEWKEKLGDLRRQDPAGYIHEVVLHAGKGHWMDREDAAAIGWMAKFTRQTAPKTLVWKPDGASRPTFYWLAVPAAEKVDGTDAKATIADQQVSVTCIGATNLAIRLRDGMIDLDRPVRIVANGRKVFDSQVQRTVAVIAATMTEREDPGLIFVAEVRVTITQRE